MRWLLDRLPFPRGFVFMGLPFLLCLGYLKGCRVKYILSLVVSAMVTILALAVLSVNPEPAATDFIHSMNHIGFDTSGEFTHPVNYYRRGHLVFFKDLIDKIRVSSIALFAFLYALNACCVYFLFKNQTLSTVLLVRRKMVWCLSFIHIAALPLIFMGLDYGRWFSFTFLTGCLVLMEGSSAGAWKEFFLYRDKKTIGLWVFFSVCLYDH